MGLESVAGGGGYNDVLQPYAVTAGSPQSALWQFRRTVPSRYMASPQFPQAVNSKPVIIPSLRSSLSGCFWCWRKGGGVAGSRRLTWNQTSSAHSILDLIVVLGYEVREVHLYSWIKRDQLDVTCFIISLFIAQHVSDVNTPILRSLRLICWVISWVVLFWFDVCWCYVVVWLWWCGIRMQAEALVPQPASRKLLRMDVLTSETCWAINNEIIKQVT